MQIKRLAMLWCICAAFILQANAQDIRINSGGSAVTTESGLTFDADNYFTNGSPYVNNAITNIAASVDDPLYLSERRSNVNQGPLNYAIPVANGTYLLRLHFAEIYFGAPNGGPNLSGQRVFDLSIEGVLELNDFDILDQVGTMTATIHDVMVTVADDTLNLDFLASVDQPKLSAFEVLSLPAGQLVPLPSMIGFGGQIQNQTSDPITLKLFNNTGATVTIDDVNIIGPQYNEFNHNFAGPDSVADQECYFIDLTTTPYKTGSISATVFIDHNGPGFPLQLSMTSGGIEDCNWQAKSSATEARFITSTVSSDSLMYVFGGFKSSQVASNLLESFNPYTDTWTSLDTMLLTTTHSAAVIVDDEIWAIGGFVGDGTGPATDTVQVYDVATDSWSYGPQIPSARASMGAAVVGRNIHAFGGLSDRNTNASEHWVLNLDSIGNGWIMKAAMPNPRNHFGTVNYLDKIYAVGGQINHDFGFSDTTLVDCYNPMTNTWTSLNPMSSSRSHIDGSTFAYNNYIYAAGGRNGNAALGNMVKYDINNDVWMTSCGLPQLLQGPSAQLIGNKIVLGLGGINGPLTPASEAYCREVPPEYTCEIPTGLTVTGTTPGSISISWNNSATAPAFRVRYNTNGLTDYVWLTTDGSPDTEYTITGLVDSTLYDIVVKTLCPGRFSDFSSPVSAMTDTFTCIVPQNVRAIAATPGTITVSWDGQSTAPAFRVRHRKAGTSTWTWNTPVGSPNKSFVIKNLFSNTCYEIEVKSLCVGAFSDFAPTLLASTDSGFTCSVPQGVTVTNVGPTTAVVSWNGNATAPQHRIRYTDILTTITTWLTVPGTDTFYVISGLSDSTSYEVSVNTLCPGAFSAFSAPVPFMTTPFTCTVPTGITVTGTTPGSISIMWNDSATAPAFRVKYNTNGMTDYVWLTTDGSPNTEYTIEGLYANTLYDIEVKTLCPGRFSDFSPPISAMTDTGLTCSVPKGVFITDITPTTATVNWNLRATAPAYRVRYTEVSSGTTFWRTAPGFPNQSFTIPYLKDTTEYTVSVNTLCPGNFSPFSAPVSFTTDSFNCAVPTIVSATDLFPWKATINWDSISSAPSYRIRFNTQGMTDYVWYHTGGFPQASRTLHLLNANTTYEVVIKSLCPGNFSAFSTVFTFTTPSTARLTNEKGEGQVQVSPNPISDQFYVYFGSLEGRKLVNVHDMAGRLVYETEVSGDNMDSQTIDASSWPNGIYTLTVMMGSQSERVRIVKE